MIRPTFTGLLGLIKPILTVDFVIYFAGLPNPPTHNGQPWLLGTRHTLGAIVMFEDLEAGGL
jgi:hypothetical protein